MHDCLALVVTRWFEVIAGVADPPSQSPLLHSGFVVHRRQFQGAHSGFKHCLHIEWQSLSSKVPPSTRVLEPSPAPHTPLSGSHPYRTASRRDLDAPLIGLGEQHVVCHLPAHQAPQPGPLHLQLAWLSGSSAFFRSETNFSPLGKCITYCSTWGLVRGPRGACHLLCLPTNSTSVPRASLCQGGSCLRVSNPDYNQWL